MELVLTEDQQFIAKTAQDFVAERLAGAASELPELHQPPRLGPISTGLGEVFMYYLTIDAGASTGGTQNSSCMSLMLTPWFIRRRVSSAGDQARVSE